jgi:hypothetical protein
MPVSNGRFKHESIAIDGTDENSLIEGGSIIIGVAVFI